MTSPTPQRKTAEEVAIAILYEPPLGTNLEIAKALAINEITAFALQARNEALDELRDQFIQRNNPMFNMMKQYTALDIDRAIRGLKR